MRRHAQASRFKFFLIPIGNHDPFGLPGICHLVYDLGRARDAVVVLAGPSKMNVTKALDLGLMRGVVAQINKLLRIAFKIEEHGAHLFDVDVFPPPVEDHDQPCVALIDVHLAARVTRGVVVFRDAVVAPIGLVSVQKRLK